MIHREAGRPLCALATAALLALALLAGCTAPTLRRPGDPDAVEAKIQGFSFQPPEIRIQSGTTVRWTNLDEAAHTVTPKDKAQWGSEGSGDDSEDWLAKGKTWSSTFPEPGTYEYYCLPHPYMVGKVIVEGPEETPDNVEARVVPDPRAPGPLGRSTPARVSIELETVEKVAQLSDGANFEWWTFNGTVPGPMLRVREGDTIDLALKNAATSKNPHSIDLHSVNGPGGGARATQTPPGETTQFSWKALNPGLYVYHCASPHIPSHVANGMYGLILVEPEEGLPPVDREYFVVQGEVYTEKGLGAKGRQSFSPQKLLDEDPTYYVFNGRVGALTGSGALTANVGETVRIYFGVGGMVPSSFHVIGEIFDQVWMEGSMSSPQRHVQTTLVPAGGSTIVQFRVDVPGDYVLVDHWLTHAIDRGAAGILTVGGADDPNVFRGGGTGSGH